jgi:hypothetical protein
MLRQIGIDNIAWEAMVVISFLGPNSRRHTSSDVSALRRH